MDENHIAWVGDRAGRAGAALRTGPKDGTLSADPGSPPPIVRAVGGLNAVSSGLLRRGEERRLACNANALIQEEANLDFHLQALDKVVPAGSANGSTKVSLSESSSSTSSSSSS